jgi:small nuclear ribonucleoprotein F
MNFQLGSAEEWIDGNLAGKLGDILIRCNNVLYVAEVGREDSSSSGSSSSSSAAAAAAAAPAAAPAVAAQ